MNYTRNMEIIVIANQEGIVWKTAVTFNLSYGLAR
jgi:cellulose biosynthesis protein BcsQ